MVEFSILKLFLKDIDLYNRYNNTLKLDFIRTESPMLYRLFKALPACSVEELEAKYLTLYPVLKDGDRQVVRNILKQVEETEIAPESIISYLRQHLSQSVANELTIAAIEVSEGRKTVADLSPIISRLEVDIVEEVETEFVCTDIREMVQQEELSGGLNWRLGCLNRSLGPLRKGNFGHIFARTETGKTAMWVSEVTYMLSQVESPILIFFNEEGGQDVTYRLYSALTGLSYLELITNPGFAYKLWVERGGDKIKFIAQPEQIEKRKMENLIEELKPSLIIIDNMDKVKGFTGDRKDLILHEIYKWGRELAKTYCPIITVGQADNTGHNSMYLDESQMADSKTAKPSELDFIIGIGRIDKQGYENVRYINIPKNKCRGSKDTVEADRHGKFETVLVPHLSIYQG